jgi:hypothetical protein
MASFFKSAFAGAGKWVVSITPSHIRRLVFWCTLYTRMRNTTEIEDKSRDKLNETMKLATENDALCFPVLASSLIWSDISKCYETAWQTIAQRSNVAQSAKDFVSHIPQWLRYGSQEKMERDFFRLVDNHRALA